MAELAEKIGELSASLASIKDQVGNLATDFTSKLEKNGTVSAELKDKTDKALSELGAMTTRLGDLEKHAAREREFGEDEQKSLGDIVVDSDAFKSGEMTSSTRGKMSIRADRAAITTADGTVGVGRSNGTSLVPGQRVPGIIAPPNRRMTIRDLLMPGQTSSNNIEYVKETGFTNNAAPVAETNSKPYSDITFNMANAPVRTIAHLFKASRQILDDAVALKSYIDGRARYGLQFKEEAQLLKGDGTGQNILGVQPQATAFAPAFVPQDATPIDRLRLAMLQVVLAEYPATGFVLNPIDWAAIELTKDNEGRYIIANPQNGTSPRLWNLPIVETQSQTLGTFLTGAFSMAAQIFDRMEIEVLLSTENVDDFERNLASIRAEERLGLAVYRPEAFVTGAVSA
ncbi:phage major capsid protein [Rhizobium sp. DKSPLA3]|uniref:Phage major capsid protein n=1 Tax=Rhizobium quercicola TaxID=2901226 RepID=A0A9X1NUT9_9HYPH|nr:phage major capsid protein [Rhizobium quercicola]MCD7109716.1 phage major capsid protein [Rhizobium quercicola]